MTGEPVLAEPGDVLALRTPGRAGWWIRLGAALAGKPDLSNHVAVFHHRDPHGTGWCIGRCRRTRAGGARIRSAAEGGPRSLQQHRPGLERRARLVEEADQSGHLARGEGVALPGSVEGDLQDSLVTLHDEVVGHRGHRIPRFCRLVR